MAQRGRPKKNVPTITITKKSSDYSVTKKQMERLRDIESNVSEIRRRLFHFDEYDTISKMAFSAGDVFNLANSAEDAMCDVLEAITDEGNKFDLDELG
jgi:hypothetical protein